MGQKEGSEAQNFVVGAGEVSSLREQCCDQIKGRDLAG